VSSFVARAARGAVVVSTLAACDSGKSTTSPGDFPIRLLVSNALIAPVTVAVDGVPAVILTNGKSSTITVSSRSQWLTWTSAKPADASGQPIFDDIGEVKIAVSGINGSLEIGNVIGDQTYITARVFNLTTTPVSIGVYNGTAVSCAAALPGASGAVSGFTQIGYYRLTQATEVRAYRDPTRCSGPFLAWSSTLLASFQSKSGLLTLILEAAP
jgi:hypothetical protein